MDGARTVDARTSYALYGFVKPCFGWLDNTIAPSSLEKLALRYDVLASYAKGLHR